MIHKAAVAAKKFGPKSSKKFGKGLLGSTNGKESTCQCKRLGFNPSVGKIPWRRKWQLTPVFLSENSMNRGAWQAPWGHRA